MRRFYIEVAFGTTTTNTQVPKEQKPHVVAATIVTVAAFIICLATMF